MAKSALTVGNWLGIAGLITGFLMTSGAIATGYIFTTKGEATKDRESCMKRHGECVTEMAVQTVRVERMSVQMENIDTQQQADSKNIVRLMERFALRAEKPAPPKPLPPLISPPALLPAPVSTAAPASAPSP